MRLVVFFGSVRQYFIIRYSGDIRPFRIVAPPPPPRVKCNVYILLAHLDSIRQLLERQWGYEVNGWPAS